MEEREFHSIEDIDRFLEEEFAKEESELQGEVEDKIEEEELESEDDGTSEDETEEVEEDDEEETEEGESEEDETEDDEPEEDSKPPKKPSQEEKTNNAFAKLRIEAKENKQKADEYDAVVRKLMKEAGYTNFSEFKKAVEEQLDEKERKDAGYTKEEYDRKKQLDEEARKIKAREEALINQERTNRSKNFNDAVVEFAKQYKMGEDGVARIYNRLEELNYTVDLLISQPDPHVVIKGAMAEEVERQALESYKERNLKRKKVDKGKITTRQKEDSLQEQQDKLLEQELREYAKRRGISYD